MLDPVNLYHLAKIRQQEILDIAAEERQPPLIVIRWSRLLDPLRDLLKRRSSNPAYESSSIPSTNVLDCAPCE